MATSLSSYLKAAQSELRFQRTPKRVRVDLDGAPVADTSHAVLVWEPKRVVPSYAVPEADLLGALDPAPADTTRDHQGVRFGDDPPVLDPSVPFAVHTAAGQPMTVRTDEGGRTGAAFRLVDPDLSGYVLLDFDAFEWREEDEPIVGHPRDPFHRIDVRLSKRAVRIEHDGRVLAESTRPRLLFEGTFPFPRYYLPREDVAVPLAPGTLQTTCAYKGHATHWSAHLDGIVLANIAWSYEEPLSDAVDVRGLVSFYQERLDLFVDGERVERVRTPWS